MKRYILLALVMCLTLLFCQGCFSRSNFTAISSAILNVKRVKIDKKNYRGRTDAELCNYGVLFFSIGDPPDVEKVLDAALVAKRANVLIDAVVRWRFVLIPILYSHECWLVEGEAYVVPK